MVLLYNNVVNSTIPGQAPLQIDSLRFGYDTTQAEMVLPDLQLPAGQSCAVIGPSGCGKTTLLHLVAGLLTPRSGRVRVCGQDLGELSAAARDRFRGRHLGIVFQRLHLLPALTVLENLLLAQRLAGATADRGAALDMLSMLSVAECAQARPGRLSRGQAQRVAIARALVHRPALLLADEPTSSLDDGHAQRVLDLLLDRTRAGGSALLLVTHDARVRGRLDRELVLGPATEMPA